MNNSFIQRYLSRFDQVPFSVEMNDGSKFTIGDGEPKFEILIKNPLSKRKLMTSTSLALGEAYMEQNLIIKGDLFEALNMFMGQMAKFIAVKRHLPHFLSASLKTQQKQVCAHYDIGNDFYRLWLDDTLNYSCAYFQSNQDTLYEAQVNKTHHILTKLNLEKGMSLLDIGCGWGYLLIEAAKKYKIKGVGITLSKEQYNGFKSRIQSEGLASLLSVKLMDYRGLSKSKIKFDRVVSVGMIEHVGRHNYNLFMKEISSVLKERGICLLHYISSLQEHNCDPWIRKYIFPGGMLPSLREIVSLCADHDFHILDVESLRRHYAKTLLSWNSNFQEHKEEIQKMFDDQFVRMWELYLCTCASSFQNGVIDLHQILFTKGNNNQLPMTRNYIYKASSKMP